MLKNKQNYVLNSFKEWLIKQNVEILSVKNENEFLRITVEKCITLDNEGNWSDKEGELIFAKFRLRKKLHKISLKQNYNIKHLIQFIKDKKEINVINDIMNKTIKRITSKRRRNIILLLLKRDGNKCFYCNKILSDTNITIEHLLSISHGGNNNINNLILCHSKCNISVGNLSVIEKFKHALNTNKDFKILTKEKDEKEDVNNINSYYKI